MARPISGTSPYFHHSAGRLQLELYDQEVLRPRERRQPRVPNATSPLIEHRVLAFALAHPGFGPARIAVELARDKWGGSTPPKYDSVPVWWSVSERGLGPSGAPALGPRDVGGQAAAFIVVFEVVVCRSRCCRPGRQGDAAGATGLVQALRKPPGDGSIGRKVPRHP